jgi:hypothetical protein
MPNFGINNSQKPHTASASSYKNDSYFKLKSVAKSLHSQQPNMQSGGTMRHCAALRGTARR